MRKLLLALLPVAALLVWSPPAQAAQDDCTGIAAPTVPGAQVTTITGTERHDYEVPPGPFNPEPITDIPDFCEVVLTLTHPGADDTVTVEVWLPLEWSGRFQGTGGGGFIAGFFDTSLAPAVMQGYAAAATDAGVSTDPFNPGTWYLGDNGDQLLENFASRSLHDMAVAGKALTAQFYGRPADYSYWTGCSTGGRQGLMEAQRYPTDYDGILANAPAINWNKFLIADLWPQVVMNQAGVFPTACELQAFADAAVQACDRLDKVADNVIGDPSQCRFDPHRLVGKKVECAGQQQTITRAEADVVAKIWAGPGVWSGLAKGTSFAGIGVPGQAFDISANWIKYFLKQDPSFDTSTIGYGDFYRLFHQSYAQFGRVIETANPDLSGFRGAGGKMITWHGQGDELIFPTGTIDYYKQVRHADDFYRLFLAPGVGHCFGGNGPFPTDPLAALVNWVEHGKAPETLPAATQTSTRNLCRYPLVSRYNGHGDPAQASSYRCAKSY